MSRRDLAAATEWLAQHHLVPPAVPLPAGLFSLDDRVDAWLEANLRGRPAVDRVMYLASALGDHGIIWMVLAGTKWATHRDDGPRPLVRVVAGLAIESVVVNGPVKWVFRRRRPVHDGPRPIYLRQPRSSSFPSGHATAAFFAAALLRDDDPFWPVYYALAGVVATSRAHVRIHHASDVIGGVVLGVTLGELTRHFVPLAPRPGRGGLN